MSRTNPDPTVQIVTQILKAAFPQIRHVSMPRRRRRSGGYFLDIIYDVAVERAGHAPHTSYDAVYRVLSEQLRGTDPASSVQRQFTADEIRQHFKIQSIMGTGGGLARRDVDGFDMGVTRQCMWIPSHGLDQSGRYRVEWWLPVPPKSPRVRNWPTEPRKSVNDCDTLVEAQNYLVARSKYENNPELTIRIVDKATGEEVVDDIFAGL